MSFLSKIPGKVRDWWAADGEADTPTAPTQSSAPLSSPGIGPGKYLEAIDASSPSLQRFQLSNRLEIGRAVDGRTPAPGHLLLSSPAVSWRHCIITQSSEGRCFVRDVSRNGTRLDGRRLLPNMETEIHLGQTLDLGHGLRFVLRGEPGPPQVSVPATRIRTELEPNLTVATVLVGDIRDYTVLVREAPATELQRSVSRVFEHLTATVQELGGTVKEFPGDAVLAFWEGAFRGDQALAACRAAIALDRRARLLAADRTVWSLEQYPLTMDWALATGQVVIDSFGGDTPIGLSMVGEPIVLACRLEKMATDETGPIITCHLTRQLAIMATRSSGGESLEFLDLGPMQCKGFDEPEQAFALRVPVS